MADPAAAKTIRRAFDGLYSGYGAIAYRAGSDALAALLSERAVLVAENKQLREALERIERLRPDNQSKRLPAMARAARCFRFAREIARAALAAAREPEKEAVWTFTSEEVNPQDPILAGPRWRDALGDVARIAQQLLDDPCSPVSDALRIRDRALNALGVRGDEAIAVLRPPRAGEGGDVSTVHVLPVNDLIEHEEEGDECVCGPDVEFVSGGKVVVHHSFDGREEKEET